MTPVDRLRTATSSMELLDVFQIMAIGDYNQLPVMDGRLLKGIIHRGDLLRYIQTRQELGAGVTSH